MTPMNIINAFMVDNDTIANNYYGVQFNAHAQEKCELCTKHIRHAWAWLEGVIGVCFKFLSFPFQFPLSFSSIPTTL